MTGATNAIIRARRLRYNAALAAHQGSARALNEALASGKGASQEMIRAEANARAELDRARAALLAAMSESITGIPAAEPAEPPEPPVSRGAPKGQPDPP
jgi:hypothetical protein